MDENPYESPRDDRRGWPSAGALWADNRTKPCLIGAPILAAMAATELAEGKTTVALIAAVLFFGCGATLLRRANQMRCEV